jgi:XapX domain-containing protein
MPHMGTYIVALAAGVAVGVFYGCLDVRSPAPPVVALVGLFGMLIGEQIIPVDQRSLAGRSLPAAWTGTLAGQHVFAMLPGHHGQAVQHLSKSTEEQT